MPAMSFGPAARVAVKRGSIPFESPLAAIRLAPRHSLPVAGTRRGGSIRRYASRASMPSILTGCLTLRRRMKPLENLRDAKLQM